MQRFRFSIASLLVLIAMAAGLLAYVSHCRQKGRDALIQSLRNAAAALKSIDQADADTKKLLSRYDFPITKWSQFFGTSQKPVFDITFDSNSVLNQQTTRKIAIGNSDNAITNLRFHLAEIADDSRMFFKDWRELRHIEIRDTSFPVAWLKQLSSIPRLESLVISGGKCNLEPKDLKGIDSLKLIRFADRGITSSELDSLRRLYPKVEIQLVAGYDSPFGWPKDKPLSAHNPEAFARMKAVLDRLHSALDNLKPPATNQFNPPASEVDIAAVETELGMPLHPSVRALLEIHNGQPTWKDELVTFERLLSTDKIVSNYDLYQDFSHNAGQPYNFEPHFEQNSNPNLLPIGSSDDNELAINLVDGTVWEFYSESYRPNKQANSLIEYFTMIIDELEAGRFERSHNGHGRVRVKGFGPTDW